MSMAEVLITIEELKEISPFSRNRFIEYLKQIGTYSTPSAANHLVDKLVSEGTISRIGRNRYIAEQYRKDYVFTHSDTVNTLAAEISSRHPFLDFRIFELVQLNEFVNHQIAHNIIFVYVERGFEEDVFVTLKAARHPSILVKPDINLLFRYLTDETIVIGSLPSESPKGKPSFWDTRPEKFLVDLATDKLLKQIVYHSEYPGIFQGAFKNYRIDKSTMMRYARRRGAEEKYKDFLVHEAQLPEEILA